MDACFYVRLYQKLARQIESNGHCSKYFLLDFETKVGQFGPQKHVLKILDVPLLQHLIQIIKLNPKPVFKLCSCLLMIPSFKSAVFEQGNI